MKLAIHETFDLMMFMFQESFQNERDQIVNDLRWGPELLCGVTNGAGLEHWMINFKVNYSIGRDIKSSKTVCLVINIPVSNFSVTLG